MKAHIKTGGNMQQNCWMKEMKRILWLDYQNKRNVSISFSIIQVKAKQIHRELAYNMGGCSNAKNVENSG